MFHEKELEKGIIGALLIDKDCINEIGAIIDPEDFHYEPHQIVIKGILDLYDQNKPIDLLTVTQYLKSQDLLENAGGAYEVSTLTNSFASSVNAEYYYRIIQQKRMLRDIWKTASETVQLTQEVTADPFELIDDLNIKLLKITEGIDQKQSKHISDGIEKTLQKIEKLSQSDSQVLGVPSGFYDLDSKTLGWNKGETIIIAGRPSMGKTALVLSMMRNASLQGKYHGLMFSYEMTNEILKTRFLAIESKIPLEKIRAGRVDQNDMKRLISSAESIKSSRIEINDQYANIREVRSISINKKKKGELDYIILDYIQIMPVSKTGGNREQEISSISRQLKQLAVELDVPIIILAQLSREVEKRPGLKIPQLSDLRESGAIEQDADIVIFLWRPEYYRKTSGDIFDQVEISDGNFVSCRDIAIAIIAKNRNGSLGKVPLKFTKHCAHFDNYNTTLESIPRDIETNYSPLPKDTNEEDVPF